MPRILAALHDIAIALWAGGLWVSGYLVVVAGQFGVQPILAGLKEQALPREVMESVFRDRFATWHGVASILYVIESFWRSGW
jgi:hypothetical protein